MPGALDLPAEGRLPPFDGAIAWINSPPLTPKSVRGKVVLVDFWTYTCINWLRTLPYVRAWSEKYQNHGLVVIGVHTPEFTVEHTIDNIRRAVTAMRISYPVAVDSDFSVWKAFSNHYWPAIYLADAEGQIRYHQFGEGNYDQTEMVIQYLLTEAGYADIGQDLVSVHPQRIEVQADWDDGRVMSYAYAEARTLREWARLSLEQGESEPARERLAAAAGTFRRLGARRDLAETESLDRP